jgi:hypothetical protein
MGIYMKRLLGLLLLLTISACGPIYDTRYEYINPESFEGRQCVNQCAAVKQSCKNQCAINENMCNTNNNVIALAQKDGTNTVPRSSCSSRYCINSCDSEYYTCFKNCGGVIHSETVCVAFCK